MPNGGDDGAPLTTGRLVGRKGGRLIGCMNDSGRLVGRLVS